MGGQGGAGLRRMLPSLVFLAGLLAFTALWLHRAPDLHGTYFALFRLLGVPAFRFPFLDTHGVLAVIDCHRQGFDVYRTNPCDVMGRVHVYTPLWFRAAALPIGVAATPAAGFLLAVLFALSLALLPAGRGWGAAWLVSAAAVSPAMAFAAERGNADLLMFALAALAGWVVIRASPVRLLAYPTVVLAAALKLYPATLLILALRERVRLCLTVAGLSAGALLAYAAIDRVGLREMLPVLPTGSPFIYAFGARDLALGLGAAFGWPRVAPAAIQATALFAMMAFALMRRPALRPAIVALTEAEAAFLMIGTALIVGCFVLGQSGEYRAVHLLFVLPALTAMAGPGCRLATCAVWVILAQLWGDLASGLLHVLGGIAPGDVAGSGMARVLWLARELAWWWIVAALLAVLLALAQGLPSVAGLRSRR